VEEDWRGIGTDAGNRVDGVDVKAGRGLGDLGAAREGLVTVGSRKEKKLWDSECLC